MICLYAVTEDALSEAVTDRLVTKVNNGLQITVRMGRRGNGYLQAKFSELLRLARNIPVLLLTDLDTIECPPTLIANWTGGRTLPHSMLFRVAVREIEAWLLADREGFSTFFHVPLVQLPHDSETINDPKELLLKLVQRYSNREIKSAILPERGSKAKIGLGYNQMLIRFVNEAWSIERATGASDSLSRTLERLEELSEIAGP